MNTIKNCSYIKLVLLSFVVFYHCIVPWNGRWFLPYFTEYDPLMSEFAKLLNTFHIYCFVIVSGYIFSYLNSINNYKSYQQLIKKKTSRLLVPYFFISIVWVVPIYVFFYGFDLADLIKKFLLMTSPNQLWFLIMLYGVFLIMGKLALANGKEKIMMITSLSCFVFSQVLIKFIPNYFQISNILLFTLPFYIGYSMHSGQLKVIFKVPTRYMLSVVILLFICYFYFDYYNDIKLLKLCFLILLNTIGSAFIFVLLDRIINKFTIIKKATPFLNYSMSIYLVHQQFIFLLLFFFAKYIPKTIFIPLCFILTILLSFIMSKFLMKIKLIKKLMGE